MGTGILFNWDFLLFSILYILGICLALYVALNIIHYVSYYLKRCMNKEQVIPFADVADIEPSCAVEYAIEIGEN